LGSKRLGHSVFFMPLRNRPFARKGCFFFSLGEGSPVSRPRLQRESRTLCITSSRLLDLLPPNERPPPFWKKWEFLPAAPRFLHDVEVGGRLLFAVPPPPFLRLLWLLFKRKEKGLSLGVLAARGRDNCRWYPFSPPSPERKIFPMSVETGRGPIFRPPGIS